MRWSGLRSPLRGDRAAGHPDSAGLGGVAFDARRSSLRARCFRARLVAALAAWMTWKSDGHDFHVAAASPALLEAANLLGFPPDFLQGEGLST